jgi:hypothetical protein
MSLPLRHERKVKTKNKKTQFITGKDNRQSLVLMEKGNWANSFQGTNILFHFSFLSPQAYHHRNLCFHQGDDGDSAVVQHVQDAPVRILRSG